MEAHAQYDVDFDSVVDECNKANVFEDSALVYNGAVYDPNSWTWKDSLPHQYMAWSDLFRCALTEAHKAPGKYDANQASACSNYLNTGNFKIWNTVPNLGILLLTWEYCLQLEKTDPKLGILFLTWELGF